MNDQEEEMMEQICTAAGGPMTKEEIKLVGARKRKPTSISKIITDEIKSEAEEEEEERRSEGSESDHPHRQKSKLKSILDELKRNKCSSTTSSQNHIQKLIGSRGECMDEDFMPEPTPLVLRTSVSEQDMETDVQTEPLDLSVDAVDLSRRSGKGRRGSSSTGNGPIDFRTTPPNFVNPASRSAGALSVNPPAAVVNPMMLLYHQYIFTQQGNRGNVDHPLVVPTSNKLYDVDHSPPAFHGPKKSASQAHNTAPPTLQHLFNNNNNNNENVLIAKSLPEFLPQPPTQVSQSQPHSINNRKSSKSTSSEQNPAPSKPKQRRYRTERPFACPHCPARFTLRSNMERHGKHQHASVWQRSPSNRVLNKQKLLLQQQQQQQQPLQQSLNQPPPSKLLHHTPQDLAQQPDIKLKLSSKLKRKLSDDTTGGLLLSANNSAASELASVDKLLKIQRPDIQGFLQQQQQLEVSGRRGRAGKAKSLTSEEEEEEEEEMLEVEEAEDTEHMEEEEEEEEEYDEDEEQDGVDLSMGSGASGPGGKRTSAYSSAPHKISCPHCSRRFPWTSSLRRHLLTHTGQKPYQCSKCPLLFTTKSNCDRHLLRKHKKKRQGEEETDQDADDDAEEGQEGVLPEEEVKSLEQDMDAKSLSRQETEEEEEDAEETSMTPSTATAQANNAHNNTTTAAAGMKPCFRCHLCENVTSGSRRSLLEHMEEHHKELYEEFRTVIEQSNNEGNNGLACSLEEMNDEDDVALSAAFSQQQQNSNRKVLCAFCLRRFWSVEDLRRHIRSHTGERPFSCSFCSRRFTLKHSMMRHLKKHAGSKNCAN